MKKFLDAKTGSFARASLAAFLIGAQALLGCSGHAETETVSTDESSLNSNACSPTYYRSTRTIETYALPNAGEAPFVDAIDSATSKIRVFIYQMGTGGIFDALKRQAANGIHIQMILDEGQKSNNQRFAKALEDLGAEILWSDPQFQYMHAKVLIIDDATSVISTGNYGRYYMSIERNFAVRDDDADDVADLVELFEADWNHRAPKLSCTRLVVSPINARKSLVDLIRSAKSEILIESMQFSDSGVQDAVEERVRAGVSVKALLANPGWISANTRAAASLLAAGAAPSASVKSASSNASSVAPGTTEARYDGSIHTKMIMVDGKSVYIGSTNLSRTSIDDNREVGLVLSDSSSVKTVRATFDADWKTATTF